jgi:hypothetical protein
VVRGEGPVSGPLYPRHANASLRELEEILYWQRMPKTHYTCTPLTMTDMVEMVRCMGREGDERTRLIPVRRLDGRKR